ncbi:MAG TPA: tetratricopeptide repeat protein [Gammaproteobacteria bacterium]|nr:tetratricopeptide repeat protein [Gammaproteobacteria bacterium]
MHIIDNLEKMLAAGQDNALLRYSLGVEYHKAGELDRAAEHLAQAVAQDADYSAAWKLMGRVLAEAGRSGEAAAAFRSGIEVATRHGDVQAAKEMQVFLRRLDKNADGP